MDNLVIDNNILKIHGYISSSDEDSDGESKSKLDALYEALKPPPIEIDPKVYRIIEIVPEKELEIEKTEYGSYSNALKHNLAFKNEQTSKMNKAVTETNLSTKDSIPWFSIEPEYAEIEKKNQSGTSFSPIISNLSKGQRKRLNKALKKADSGNSSSPSISNLSKGQRKRLNKAMKKAASKAEKEELINEENTYFDLKSVLEKKLSSQTVIKTESNKDVVLSKGQRKRHGKAATSSNNFVTIEKPSVELKIKQTKATERKDNKVEKPTVEQKNKQTEVTQGKGNKVNKPKSNDYAVTLAHLLRVLEQNFDYFVTKSPTDASPLCLAIQNYLNFPIVGLPVTNLLRFTCVSIGEMAQVYEKYAKLGLECKLSDEDRWRFVNDINRIYLENGIKYKRWEENVKLNADDSMRMSVVVDSLNRCLVKMVHTAHFYLDHMVHSHFREPVLKQVEVSKNLNHYKKNKSKTVGQALSQLVIEDLTENHKYFYDCYTSTNFEQWRTFQSLYLDSSLKEQSQNQLKFITEDLTPNHAQIDICCDTKSDSIVWLEYALLWMQVCDAETLFKTLILLTLFKVVLWLLYYCIVFLMSFILSEANVILLILLLLYLCIVFVIKF